MITGDLDPAMQEFFQAVADLLETLTSYQINAAGVMSGDLRQTAVNLERVAGDFDCAAVAARTAATAIRTHYHVDPPKVFTKD